MQHLFGQRGTDIDELGCRSTPRRLFDYLLLAGCHDPSSSDVCGLFVVQGFQKHAEIPVAYRKYQVEKIVIAPSHENDVLNFATFDQLDVQLLAF
jgi:hypothetical protein